jgi:ArsR family transcriptional regulator
MQEIIYMLQLTEFFKAAGDPTRQRILNLLLNYASFNVNDLCTILSEPQSKISRHLKILRNSGWVMFTRRDKWVYYRLNPDLNKELLEVLKIIFKDYLEFESDLKNAQAHV